MNSYRTLLIAICALLGSSAQAGTLEDSTECSLVTQAPVELQSVSRTVPGQTGPSLKAKVYIDSLGRAQKVIVLNGKPGSAIDEGVRKAALGSSFLPARRQGKAVSGVLFLEFGL